MELDDEGVIGSFEDIKFSNSIDYLSFEDELSLS